MGSKLTHHNNEDVNLPDQPMRRPGGRRNRKSFWEKRRGYTEDENGFMDFLNIDFTEDDTTAHQSSPYPVNETEKCYDPNDTTLTFVDGNDDMDFLWNDYTSLRARMSCGHTVTPMSLTDWCRRQLDEGASRFTCGQTGCTAVWTYDEVCKMALLTPEENKYFEEKLFRNLSKDNLNVKSCPGCKCRVVRHNPNNLCVKCPKCTANNTKPYKFCWQCLKEWKGPVPASDRCENANCCNEQLRTLKNCPVIEFKDVKGVRGCPSVRACPTCGKLLEHSKMRCKFIVCKRCTVKFCFVCLKFYPECCNYFELCLSGVAPRQTSIPVWEGSNVNNPNVDQ